MPPDRIVFIKTSSLGDVVHHMPAVADARRRLPGAHISWVVEEGYVPLVALLPGVDDIIPVATRRWRKAMASRAVWREVADVRRRLRQAPPGVVIDCQGLLRTVPLVRWAQGIRHGFDRNSIKEPLAAMAYDVRHAIAWKRQAVDRNRTLTGLALGYVPPPEIDFGLKRPEQGEAASSAVLLHATARAEKEWPEANWITLGRQLSARGLAVILPAGNDAERSRSQRIADQVPGAVVPPPQALDQVANLIGAARLVVGVDTGLLHLAAAFGVPSVGLYLASDPALNGPCGPGPLTVLGGPGAPPSLDAVLNAAFDLVGTVG